MDRSTVSFNSANDNGELGIASRGEGTLLTRNTAMANGLDFLVRCPGRSTDNTSSGAPDSYHFFGAPPCYTAHNN